MEGGDLSDRLAPRWLIVFERVLATLPPDRVARFKLLVRLGRWSRAMALYEVEPHVQKVLNDLYWRRDYRFDAVTFLGEPAAVAIRELLDQLSLPVSNVWAVTEETLAQRLAYMPDVQYVVHGDPARHLSYGNRGLLVTDPGRLQL